MSSRSIGLLDAVAVNSVPILITLSLTAPMAVVVALPMELLHLLRLRAGYRECSAEVSNSSIVLPPKLKVSLILLHLFRPPALKSAPVLMMPLRLARVRGCGAMKSGPAMEFSGGGGNVEIGTNGVAMPPSSQSSSESIEYLLSLFQCLEPGWDAVMGMGGGTTEQPCARGGKNGMAIIVEIAGGKDWIGNWNECQI